MRYRGSLGFMLLAIYLILVGLSSFGVSFPGLATIIAILALAAGIMILVYRY